MNDLESYITNKAVPYCVRMYRLSKLAGKYNLDSTPEESEKLKIDTIVIDEEK